MKQDDITASADMNAANVVIDDEEDPYEKVMGDSGGGMVLVSQNIANPDDPYSVVLDQTAVMVLSRSTGASPPMAASNSSNDQGAGLNLNNSANGLGQDNHLRLQYADEEGDSQDDYATVVKDRSSPTSREGSNQGGGGDEEEIEPYFTTPPEPPRLYGASEVWGAGVGVMEETSTHGERQGFTAVLCLWRFLCSLFMLFGSLLCFVVVAIESAVLRMQCFLCLFVCLLVSSVSVCLFCCSCC